MTTQKRNPQHVDLLSVDFQRRYEANFALGNAGSILRGLPGLRAAWIASSVDENGAIYDLSGQGRTFTRSGQPTFGFTGIAPWVFFDSAIPDYFYRTDEPGMQISGLETINQPAVRGLSLGGWFKFTSLATTFRLFYKWHVAGGRRAFGLFYEAAPTNKLIFLVDETGTGVTWAQVVSTVDVVINKWYFVAGTFDPSTSMNIYVNRTKTTLAAGIPASAYTGTTRYDLGGGGGVGFYLPGYFSFGFLSSMFLSDSVINNLYQQTRALYGI